MSFSINTNVASLQAQNYLRINSDFQNKTINRVTSGLRIVSSGDDAAGLAVANGLRSDEAVLTQGVRNANDGLSQLQIADGGLNNISQLLDRARTLATQSASGAFTGDRSVLNQEFQSVLTEIDRQAQAIGLNQGGTFAKSLSVFIGGGKGQTSTDAITNGSVSVDLSSSTVDSKSLNLKGVQATGAANSDIGTGSSTSVQNILSNTTNTGSESVAGFTNFYFTGPGFSDTFGSNVVKVSVNLGGVTDTTTLAAAVNAALQNAGNGSTQQATAFKNANITASGVTDSQGRQQLGFNSSTAAFQVQGGDRVATALLGNFQTGTTGNSAATTATGGTVTTAAAVGNANIRILGAGLNGSTDLAITIGVGDTGATYATKINTAIAGNATAAATGITASFDSVANKLVFSGRTGQSFEVQVAGDKANNLGFGTYLNSAAFGAGNFDYNTITGAGAISGTATDAQTIEVSIGGGAKQTLAGVAVGANQAAALANLNAAIQGNAVLRDSGLIAVANGATKVTFQTSNGANFRLNFVDTAGTNAFGFGNAATAAASSASTSSLYAAKDNINSAGANQSVNAANADVYSFKGLRNASDSQTVTLAAVDPSGAQHTLNVGLTSANGNNLDQAVSTINAALQQSNDSTLRQLVAVKEAGTSGAVNGVEGIRFLSGGPSFKVSFGSTALGSGIADGQAGAQGELNGSALNGAGSTADISSQATAQAAVSALSTSISTLGKAQAVVGKGQNQFNFAINLAQSQLTNLATAESRIRDADLAAEAANLTKAQILLQAGVAALAQANSAPQQVLSLLRG